MNTTELLIIAEALHMALTKENNYEDSDYETLTKAADIVDGHLGINIPMKDLEEVALVDGEYYWIKGTSRVLFIAEAVLQSGYFLSGNSRIPPSDIVKLQHIPRPSDNDIGNAKEVLDKLGVLLDTKRN